MQYKLSLSHTHTPCDQRAKPIFFSYKFHFLIKICFFILYRQKNKILLIYNSFFKQFFFSRSSPRDSTGGLGVKMVEYVLGGSPTNKESPLSGLEPRMRSLKFEDNDKIVSILGIFICVCLAGTVFICLYYWLHRNFPFRKSNFPLWKCQEYSEFVIKNVYCILIKYQACHRALIFRQAGIFCVGVSPKQIHE